MKSKGAPLFSREAKPILTNESPNDCNSTSVFHSPFLPSTSNPVITTIPTSHPYFRTQVRHMPDRAPGLNQCILLSTYSTLRCKVWNIHCRFASLGGIVPTI